jgi:hypothetical protein
VAKATSNVRAKLVAPPHSVPAVKPKEDAQASATRKPIIAAITTWLERDLRLFKYLGKKEKNYTTCLSIVHVNFCILF